MKKFFENNRNVIWIALCVIAFALITLVYFSPITQGKRLKQHDIEMYKGMSQEIVDFKVKTGEQSLWTNSMFGGMPAWNIGVPQNSNLMTYINRILAVGFPHPIGAVSEKFHHAAAFSYIHVQRMQPFPFRCLHQLHKH